MKKFCSIVLALVLIGALFAAPTVAQEENVKLTWVQGTGADAPADVEMVNEALNVISREKLGVEVEIKYMTGDQVNLSVTSGEVYDMYFTCDWYNDYVTRAFGGIFADITDLVKTETPDLYATMPEEVWEGAKVDGKIYAIPVKKDYCPEIFLLFDKEFYKEIGMEIPAEMNFLDLEPYLEAYAKDHPGVYPLTLTKSPSGIDATFNFLNRDCLIGFPYSAAGGENATKIISIFEDEEVTARFKKIHEWFEKGYINPDAAVLEETGVNSKLTFVKLGQGFYGADAIWSAGNQYAVQISKISGPYLSASGIMGSMNAISSALDEEKVKLCLRYQELVNTNHEYRDMLRYGIEGTHFNYNKDGTVLKTDEGVNKYSPWAFSQGSYALSSVEASQFAAVPVDPHMWDVVFKGYEDALVSASFGFNFDPSEYETEIAQLRLIKEKWLPLIYTGTEDPETAIPKCIEEMEAAGLRDVIAGAQAQLDEFLATK